MANSRCTIAPLPLHVALNGNVVGRISEHHVRSHTLQQLLIAGRLERVAAQQAMAPERPQIAGAGDGDRGRRYEHVGGIARRGKGCGQALDTQIDLACAKAGELDAKVEIKLGQLFELLSEQLLIPQRQLGQPVIGQLKRARLGWS
jgi:hypothetical protein